MLDIVYHRYKLNFQDLTHWERKAQSQVSMPFTNDGPQGVGNSEVLTEKWLIRTTRLEKTGALVAFLDFEV